MDYCLLCADEVESDHWREHMLNKHSVVLSESPKNDDGTWKELEDNKIGERQQPPLNQHLE